MSKLEDLQPGLRLAGLIPGATIAVIAVQPHGGDAIELTYKTANGELGQRVLGRDAEENLTIVHAEARPLDAGAADFKLGSVSRARASSNACMNSVASCAATSPHRCA